VIVFNVCGNQYRLIVAMHFNKQMAYTLRFLTHSEYGRDDWKNEL
jgi:mRNA interferase HigB